MSNQPNPPPKKYRYPFVYRLSISSSVILYKVIQLILDLILLMILVIFFIPMLIMPRIFFMITYYILNPKNKNEKIRSI